MKIRFIVAASFIGLLGLGLTNPNFAQTTTDQTTTTKTKKKKKKTTGNTTGTGTTSTSSSGAPVSRTGPPSSAGASGPSGAASNSGAFGTTPTPANTSVRAQQNTTPPKPKRPKEMVYVNSDKRIYYRKACPPETATWQTVSLSDAKRSNFKEAKCSQAGR